MLVVFICCQGCLCPRFLLLVLLGHLYTTLVGIFCLMDPLPWFLTSVLPTLSLRRGEVVQLGSPLGRLWHNTTTPASTWDFMSLHPGNGNPWSVWLVRLIWENPPIYIHSCCFTENFWERWVFLSLDWQVAVRGGSMSPHSLVRPGFHFVDLGVELDGSDKGCAISCVYLHSTCVDAGWKYFSYLLHFIVYTNMLTYCYHFWCATHHIQHCSAPCDL